LLISLSKSKTFNRKLIQTMKVKQLIERALPFDQKYIYMGITRGSIESGQLTSCDNCGKLITNMVQVVNKETKQKFTIGTDCAETLVNAKCLYNNGTATDYQIDIYSYNQVARFVTELNAGIEMTNEGFQYSLVNRKGKTMKVWANDLRKFFPELLTEQV
jgi:hypothetical protein